MDHSDRARCLKLAFGTCIIFSRTPDEIYVAADTQQTIMKDDGSEPECTESVCKIVKLGTSTYLASSGLAYLGSCEVRGLCEGVFDPDRSIRENIELIHCGLYDKYLKTITDVARNKRQQFDRYKKNPVHVALFGLENESLVISALELIPFGPDDVTVEVDRKHNVGTKRRDPSYVMGHCQAIKLEEISGGGLPDIDRVGIREWLEASMKRSLAPHEHPKCDGPDFVILRIGIDREEEWIRPSEACKDF